MFSRVADYFNWRPSPAEFSAPLRSGKNFTLAIDRLPRGIDNAHVDVTLSPRFSRATRLLARHLLQREVAQNHWGALKTAATADTQAFKAGYIGMMEIAIDRARQSGQFELIQLLQLSVVKFLLQTIGDEFERLRGKLQRSRATDSRQSSGQLVEVHERLVILAKEEPALRYHVARRLFREIGKVEDMRLSKLRNSILGEAWPLPRQLLLNPLLQLPSLWADEQLMRHYTLVCTCRDENASFDRINRLLLGMLSDYLPQWSWPADTPAEASRKPVHDDPMSTLRERRDKGELTGFLESEMLLAWSLQKDEFEQGRQSWLDYPANISRLLHPVDAPAPSRSDPLTAQEKMPWREPRWERFQQRLLRQLFREIHRKRLVRQILACELAPAIYDELNGRVPVRIVCQYLAGSIKRRTVLQRLQGVADPQQKLRLLDRALNELRHMHRDSRRRLLLEFLQRFLELRRDLKLAYRAHWAMHHIRLLSIPRELELSRNNGTLHEFVLHEELQPEQQRIRNHVVLKADVRGSTAMTEQLRERGLNPASHFSLNFFEPINKLLTSYGAKKTFVEGDAVILSIFEYEDTPYQWLCVSHACGLAANILKVVDAQNAENQRRGLPVLELGLGIAFSDQAPTFLYDQEREIMISSAINRADRLSSCSASLRNSAFGRELGRGVEVVAKADQLVADKGRRERLIRYNVNGIELDTPAFLKLQSELSMKLVDTAGMFAGGGRCYVGRYPDLKGRMHWLVVREAAIRRWSGGGPGSGEQYGQRFYQLLTDPDLLKQIIEQQADRRPVSLSQDSRTPGRPPGRYLH